MARNNPRGLVPTRGIGSSARFRTNRYPVSSDNPTALFIGDPVELNDGNVRRHLSESANSAGS